MQKPVESSNTSGFTICGSISDDCYFLLNQCRAQNGRLENLSKLNAAVVFFFVFFGRIVSPPPMSSPRGVSTTSLLSSSDVSPAASAAAQSQPIVISDTPSPAVSIITIHSDTDTEDERKFHPARSVPEKPALLSSAKMAVPPGGLRLRGPFGRPGGSTV